MLKEWRWNVLTVFQICGPVRLHTISLFYFSHPAAHISRLHLVDLDSAFPSLLSFQLTKYNFIGYYEPSWWRWSAGSHESWVQRVAQSLATESIHLHVAHSSRPRPFEHIFKILFSNEIVAFVIAWTNLKNQFFNVDDKISITFCNDIMFAPVLQMLCHQHKHQK